MRWSDPVVAAVGFLLAFGLVRSGSTASLPSPVEPTCPPIEVSAPCRVVTESLPAVPELDVVPPLDEPPDVEEGREVKAELLGCLGPGATAWLDCAEAPCLVAGVALVDHGFTSCFPGKVTWRTIDHADGGRVNVGVIILGEEGLRPYARRARMFDELVEHVESGALEVE